MPNDKKSEGNKPRWYNDNWVVNHPDPTKIKCADCYHRAKDVKNKEGKVIINGATKAVCNAYDYKPSEILWEGGDCDYYLSENDED